MVNYRGYLIHFRSEVLSWRFMAAPASPELPILSRGVSRQFSSRDEALAECCWIRASASVGVPATV